MLEAEVNNELTILDYMNEDCWRAVLRLVPIRDLIVTECASRRWQEVVLTYLRGVRISLVDKESSDPYALKLERSEDILKSFESWTIKLGSSVVNAYCHNMSSLKIISEYCPNIEELKFIRMDITPEVIIPSDLSANFCCLKRVCFHSCDMTDESISQFLVDRAVEELKFDGCYTVTGLFFSSVNLSNLKCLDIDLCRNLKPEYMLPAIDCLSELKKLTLAYIPDEIFEKLQYMLDKMPKLEWLELYDDLRMICNSSVPLSRLTRLKHLRLSWQMGDHGVEAVIRGCQELHSLNLQDCQGMTSASVEALCQHAGARLTTLSLGQFYEAADDDVVELVRSCPLLTSLTVAGTGLLTPALPARAAAARRAAGLPTRPARLQLDLSYTNLTDECYLDEVAGEYEEMETEYEDLIVVL